MVVLMSILGLHLHHGHGLWTQSLAGMSSSRPRQWGLRSPRRLLEFSKKEIFSNDCTTHDFPEVGLGEIRSPRAGAGVGAPGR